MEGEFRTLVDTVKNNDEVGRQNKQTGSKVKLGAIDSKGNAQNK